MSGYIKKKYEDKVPEGEINGLLEKYSTKGALLFCVYTTHFCCTAYAPIEDISHALEIRLFDEKGEFKAVRTNIGEDFVWRYASDEGVEKDCIYDEVQYLDIDSKKTAGTKYVSTGGGEYTMPAEGFERVLIRHYGEYDDDGMFGLKDFRIVKFLRKGENENA